MIRSLIFLIVIKSLRPLGGYYLSGGYLLFNVNVISNLNDNIRFKVNVIDVLNIFCSPNNVDIFNVVILHSPNAPMVGVPKEDIVFGSIALKVNDFNGFSFNNAQVVVVVVVVNSDKIIIISIL